MFVRHPVKISSENFEWRHYSKHFNRWDRKRPQYVRHVILLKSARSGLRGNLL